MIRAHGRILFWEGASVWFFAAPPGQKYPKTERHAHHAVQLTVAIRGSIEVDGERSAVTGTSAAVKPDAEHAFSGDDFVALVFVDPDCRVGRSLVRELFSGGDVVALNASVVNDFRSAVSAAFVEHRDGEVVSLCRALVNRLAGSDAVADVHDVRVQRLIAYAAQADSAVTLEEASQAIGLSPERMRHLFVEETGLAFRTYQLWTKLRKAVEAFSAGASLTEAAHASGFSDSAHLSRTFKRMFGISADTLRVS